MPIFGASSQLIKKLLRESREASDAIWAMSWTACSRWVFRTNMLHTKPMTVTVPRPNTTVLSAVKAIEAVRVGHRRLIYL